MAGLLTDGLVDVGPASLQGIPLTNGNGTYPQITGYEQAPFDTNVANGANPQSVSAAAFNIAALYWALVHNTGTITSAAVTINKAVGLLTSDTLTTGAGATYTFTMTNSLITPASVIQVAAWIAASTAGGPLIVTNITANSGNCVISILNSGTAALNTSGSIVVLFQVAPAF